MLNDAVIQGMFGVGRSFVLREYFKNKNMHSGYMFKENTISKRFIFGNKCKCYRKRCECFSNDVKTGTAWQNLSSLMEQKLFNLLNVWFIFSFFTSKTFFIYQITSTLC